MLKDLLTIANLSKADIDLYCQLAGKIKRLYRDRDVYNPLSGKVLAMIFEKPSTRTRVSFESGIYRLGGTAINLNVNELQLSRGESVADTARVLSGYVDLVMIRTYKQSLLEEFAQNATVPVINGLSDKYHPCQIIADLFTIKETFGSWKGQKLVYLGDGNNVAHSLLLGCALVGVDICVAAPAAYQPDADVVAMATEFGRQSGASVTVSDDPQGAVAQASVLYADVWASMGQSGSAQRKKDLQPYQINASLLAHARADAVVMHCLPAHRGEEVTAEVLDGVRAIAFRQAKNRLFVQNAIMTLLVELNDRS